MIRQVLTQNELGLLGINGIVEEFPSATLPSPLPLKVFLKIRTFIFFHVVAFWSFTAFAVSRYFESDKHYPSSSAFFMLTAFLFLAASIEGLLALNLSQRSLAMWDLFGFFVGTFGTLSIWLEVLFVAYTNKVDKVLFIVSCSVWTFGVASLGLCCGIRSYISLHSKRDAYTPDNSHKICHLYAIARLFDDFQQWVKTHFSCCPKKFQRHESSVDPSVRHIPLSTLSSIEEGLTSPLPVISGSYETESCGSEFTPDGFATAATRQYDCVRVYSISYSAQLLFAKLKCSVFLVVNGLIHVLIRLKHLFCRFLPRPRRCVSSPARIGVADTSTGNARDDSIVTLSNASTTISSLPSTASITNDGLQSLTPYPPVCTPVSEAALKTDKMSKQFGVLSPFGSKPISDAKRGEWQSSTRQSRMCVDRLTSPRTVAQHGTAAAAGNPCNRNDFSFCPPLAACPMQSAALSAMGPTSKFFETHRALENVPTGAVKVLQLTNCLHHCGLLFLESVLQRKYLRADLVEAHEFAAALDSIGRCFGLDIFLFVLKIYAVITFGFSPFLCVCLVMPCIYTILLCLYNTADQEMIDEIVSID